MHNPNFSQLLMLVSNQTDFNLSKIIKKENFLFSFITHLDEHFRETKQKLSVLEPLLDPELGKAQHTALAVDGTEVGEIYLLTNSFMEESSLVYYSPSGLIESTLLEYEEYEELRISDYILLLHEFSSHLFGEKRLYSRK